MSRLSLRSTVQLLDGNTIPVLGFGTYLVDEKACLLSLKYGYRMLDTASFYSNEEDVGKALRESKVDRSEVCITTKVWDTDHGRERTMESFQKSLESLQVDYVDLYLIHSPAGGKILETWDAMLELQRQGQIRSVGVSNFNIHHLEKLLEARPDVVPAVNQIEVHPFCTRQELVTYCQSKGIVLQAYSPLTDGNKLQDPKLAKMAKKYNKTPAQVLIRWSLQKGFVCIPKTVKEERMIENADVFDFSISQQDMEEMDGWNEDCVICGRWPDILGSEWLP